MSKAELHKNICEHLNDVYVKKNNDYGDSFGDMYRELGIITAVTRIGDKFNRLKSLARKQERCVKDETIKDTLLDMANYCIMTVIEMEKESL